MYRFRVPIVVVAMVTGAALAAAPGALAAAQTRTAAPVNVDISQRHLNESEEAIAVNPTNPDNIVTVTNVGHGEAGLTAGMFEGVSFDGGKTWATKLIALGAGDPLGDACCDPSLSFDQYGNLFLTYLYEAEDQVPVALSTDGGLTFHVIANISQASLPGKKAGGDNRGLFRFVDQPTITAAHGEVWVVFNAGGPMAATGAPVTGPGQVGAFIPLEVVPGTNNCTYGDIAIGPSGQVMQACALTESGQGGGKIFVNTDPDGLGPAGFGNRIFVTQTHVGGFDFIPAQPDRSVDAEPGLAWDRTSGPHAGRVYLVYTAGAPERERQHRHLRAALRRQRGDLERAGAGERRPPVPTASSCPRSPWIPTTGNIAVVWYDSRNDLGTGGPGDTDQIPNDDAQFWGAFSINGGASFTRNIQISAGTSNSHDSGNGIDYGDYTGLSFYGGIAHPAWSDNSNSTGNNPDGALHQLDIYTAAVPAP